MHVVGHDDMRSIQVSMAQILVVSFTYSLPLEDMNGSTWNYMRLQDELFSLSPLTSNQDPLKKGKSYPV
jgi:hypothetical protein